MQLHHTTSIGDLQVFFEIIFGFFDFLRCVQLEQKHYRYHFTDIPMFFEIYFHFSWLSAIYQQPFIRIASTFTAYLSAHKLLKAKCPK